MWPFSKINKLKDELEYARTRMKEDNEEPYQCCLCGCERLNDSELCGECEREVEREGAEDRESCARSCRLMTTSSKGCESTAKP